MIEIIPHGNSGINVFKYKGQIALQVVGVEKPFMDLANAVKEDPITTIVELGTDYGGLTNLLADHPISDNAEIHTFDMNGSKFKSHNNKITFYQGTFEQHHEKITELISRNGRCLLLCDGGNKPEEFKQYQKFLKPYDIIMAHDYACKNWKWCEFTNKDADYVGLIPFLQETFSGYAWCIRMKT